ncbi:MAG: hypothetical protein B6D39_01225 [Anaerolineae bacterium UTCFX2]|jgi:glucose/mannose-6-phosphate isomerase|nr:bifunctional phosphoglucose/phosphomannose isomerase [Anaerolineae bacterium]MCZ7551515.1 bifunctional phosphoglucose/phosphomannose isomerase [Anaerolineales bacterium]OQY94565.1 MAG: hypothetical protein B6D39_01225 [Anaerolineae bacterium UTCFX2]
MKLDDPAALAQIDRQDMLAQIDGLPQQLRQAWELGTRLDLPDWKGVQRLALSGMGGSAIGADLLAAYAAPLAKTPLVVLRDYSLPAWVSGPSTLLVASSHSGNTEETLAAFHEAGQRGCARLAVATGGELERAARSAGVPLWKFEHSGQPRAAVGFSFGLLLALAARLEVLPDPQVELDDAIAAMERQQQTLNASVPAAANPAKRLASQMMNLIPTIFGSGLMAPVARRWKTQINELAKAAAGFEILPEADHNTLAGCLHPEPARASLMLLFLRSPADHPRNRLRSDLTRKTFMHSGFNTKIIDAGGETRLANLWTSLHLGDYAAFYLAMAYGVDPTPVDALETLKAEMQAAA